MLFISHSGLAKIVRQKINQMFSHIFQQSICSPLIVSFYRECFLFSTRTTKVSPLENCAVYGIALLQILYTGRHKVTSHVPTCTFNHVCVTILTLCIYASMNSNTSSCLTCETTDIIVF